MLVLSLSVYTLLVLPTAYGRPITSEILRARNYSYSFAEFEQDFAKSYASAAARHTAQDAFRANLRRARAHNERVPAPSWTMAVNRFADLTPAEFHRLFASGARPVPGRHGAVDPGTAVGGLAPLQVGVLPPSQDWRKAGIMTAPKNQGQCGSCWAFAAAEAIEAHRALATKTLPPVPVFLSASGAF